VSHCFVVLVEEFLVSCGAVSKFRKNIGVILPRLKRFALALTRSRSEMDDLVQATCERALTRVRQWDPETRLDSWMFRIMQNIWFNELRARNVRERYAEVEQAELISTGNAQVAELHVLLGRVEDEMFRLPEEQHIVLRLVYINGMTYSEVAEAKSIPLGTVMSRLARARLTLMQRLEANDTAIVGEPDSLR
jgi:RNA polymerase sigma-70 factor, ECF subfamily